MVFNGHKNPRDDLLVGVMFVMLLLNYSTWGLGSVQTCLFQGKKTAYDQDQKVMFSLLQATRNQYLPVHIILGIYQKTVLPVLLYGCEI